MVMGGREGVMEFGVGSMLFVKDGCDGGLQADGSGGEGEAEACLEVVKDGLDRTVLLVEGGGE